MHVTPVQTKDISQFHPKQRYQAPVLLVYGSVAKLTQSGTGTSSEGGGSGGAACTIDPGKKPCSARHMKENISRIGVHPLGFGLYLFDYKPEFKDYAGHGRQFGVMIDEVVGVVPQAIGTDQNGYPVVDHAMLGIERPVVH